MKQLLTSLAVLSAQTKQAEQNILDSAIKRKNEVIKQMNALRNLASTGDVDSAENYMKLVEEFGQLEKVIALSKDRLAKS